jgi:hypothetical protein
LRAARCRNERTVDGIQTAGVLLGRHRRGHTQPEAVHLARIARARERSRERANVARGYEQPVLSVDDELREGAGPRHDDGKPERLRLCHDHGEGLVHARGDDEDVEAPVDVSEPVVLELTLVSDPRAEIRPQPTEEHRIVAAAEQGQRRVSCRPRERFAENVDTLMRREAADEPESDRLLRRPGRSRHALDGVRQDVEPSSGNPEPLEAPPHELGRGEDYVGGLELSSKQAGPLQV